MIYRRTFYNFVCVRVIFLNVLLLVLYLRSVPSLYEPCGRSFSGDAHVTFVTSLVSSGSKSKFFFIHPLFPSTSLYAITS